MSAGAAIASDEITEDAFLDGRVTLLQPKNGPRAGLDAVFLAATCPLGVARILDVGSGVGAVSMCAAWRAVNAQVTGVEIDPLLAGIFRQNATANGFGERVSIIEGDLTQAFSVLESRGLRANAFDHVLSNPPFFTAGQVRTPRNGITGRAHVAAPLAMDAWFKFFAACCAPKGVLTLIHLAQSLPELLKAVEGRFGGLKVFPLFPREGEAAIRILLQGEKGSRAPLSIQRGMILHGADGAFTPEAKAILRDGAPLSLA
ncbi:MAG: methyltransferase [Hyphomicrobiales bacterium]|nr:methyltransferase [Hyphomicrobiales bacterium]